MDYFMSGLDKKDKMLKNADDYKNSMGTVQ